MLFRPSRIAILVLFAVGGSACGGDYSVPIASGSVAVASEFWRSMQNPEPFAENFEARVKRPNEEFFQILTVYKAPMRDDQRGDVAFAPSVWVDAMVVHPPAVTLQVRVAHPGHWVLSRQTFSARPGVDPSALGPFLKPDQARALIAIYEDEIRRTQSTLEAMVAR